MKKHTAEIQLQLKEGRQGNMIGNIPDPLAKVLHPLITSWKIYEIRCDVKLGKSAKATEGTQGRIQDFF